MSGDAWLMAVDGSFLSKVVTFVGVLPSRGGERAGVLKGEILALLRPYGDPALALPEEVAEEVRVERFDRRTIEPFEPFEDL